MCDTTHSGNDNDYKKYKVEIFEYQGILSVLGNNITIPEWIFTALQNNYPLPLKSPDDTAQLVNSKWIYIFKKYSNSLVSIEYEIMPEVLNGKQTYKCVSWLKEDRDVWPTTYPRTVQKTTYDSLYLSSQKEYYVLLSPIQLPYHRIVAIIKNPLEKLIPRAVHIPQNQAKDLLQLYMTDYDLIAAKLNANALRQSNNYKIFVQDEEKAKRRYLTEAVCAIAEKQPKIKEWLNFTQCELDRNSHKLAITSLEMNKDTSIARLASFVLSSGYKEMLDDHNGYEAIELTIFNKYSEILDTMAAATAGLNYLAIIVEDKKSWLSRFLLNDEPFLFHRKVATLAANDTFHDFLKDYVIGLAASRIKPKVKVSTEVQIKIQEEIIVTVERILKRADIEILPDIEHKNGKYFKVHKEELIDVITIRYSLTGSIENRTSYKADYTQRETFRKKWEGQIDKIKGPTAKLLLGFEVVNTLFAAKSFWQASEDMKTDAGVNLVGSATDAFCATEFLIRRVSNLKSAIPRFAGKIGLKLVPGVAIISAVCDFYGAFKGAKNALGEGNNGQFAGYMVIMAASVVTAVSGGAALAGALALAGTLGLIGIAVFLVGALVVWIFTEEDLEKWAKSSPWGVRYKKEITLEVYIFELHKILCQFKVECYHNRIKVSNPQNGSFYDHTLTLRIIHGLIKDGISKFKVDITIEDGGFVFAPNVFLIRKMLTLPDDNSTTLHSKNEAPAIIYRFSGQDKEIISQKKGQIRYSFKVQLDFDGNGQCMLPEKPLEEQLYATVFENDKPIIMPVMPMGY